MGIRILVVGDNRIVEKRSAFCAGCDGSACLGQPIFPQKNSIRPTKRANN